MNSLKIKILLSMKDKMQKDGWSQRDLARYYNMTQRRVWEIMTLRPDNFSLEKLIQYAEKVGLIIDINPDSLTIN